MVILESLLWLITKMYACRAHSPINPHYGPGGWRPRRRHFNASPFSYRFDLSLFNTRPGRVSEVKRLVGQVIKIFAGFPCPTTTTTNTASNKLHISINALYATQTTQRAPHSKHHKLLYDVADYDNECHLDLHWTLCRQPRAPQSQPTTCLTL